MAMAGSDLTHTLPKTVGACAKGLGRADGVADVKSHHTLVGVMTMSTSTSLALAKKHLERVQNALMDPPDWLEIATFGFYALEASVVAAAEHIGIAVTRSHPGKVNAAEVLAADHGLPDVSGLLYELNVARKSEAYGDVAFPTDLDAEEVCSAIEGFVDAVEALIGA